MLHQQFTPTVWRICYTNSFGIYAHNTQHQSRECQKKTSSITAMEQCQATLAAERERFSKSAGLATH
jgi:hypothetical protein